METVWTILISAGVGAVFGLVTQWVSAEVSNRYWLQQERWRLRGQAYRRVFKTLTAHRHVLIDWRLPSGTRTNEQMRKAYADSLTEVHIAIEFGRLFMSPAGAEALSALNKDLGREAESTPHAYLDQRINLISTVVRGPLADAARQDEV